MKLYLLATILLIQACAYGPETEKKNPLNNLNGENYENSVSVPTLFAPIAKRKERLTKLSGSIILDSGTTRIPLKMQKVTLKKNNKILAETTTGIDGAFDIVGEFVNGDYQLFSESEKYQGQLDFQISKYNQDNLVIVAKIK